MKKNKEISFKKLPSSVQAHIEHLERVRRDFIANVSHELRTPLTVIHGYLESLLKQDSEQIKPLKKIFSQMYQHSIRMEMIIDDLLLLSRLESEDQPLDEKSKINIAGMLETLYTDAKMISRNKHQQIELQADKKVLLDGGEEELKSLFSNIIINATKYTPAKGHILIEWFQDQGKAYFKVTDTGIGIAKEHLPRITERFYRVDKGRSRESGGTGLGLAIVKHVLLRHQGELQIESQFNHGSVFTCIFPEERTIIL
jgi:two-component system, OmpR family, phosphate regulon sensor histidine kinase PhoR